MSSDDEKIIADNIATGRKKNPTRKNPYDPKSKTTYDFEGKPIKFHAAKIGANAGVDKFVSPELGVGVARTKNFWDFDKRAKLQKK